MNILSESSTNLTIGLTWIEWKIIDRTIRTYDVGVSSLSLVYSSHPPFLSSVDLKSLSDKIESQCTTSNSDASNVDQESEDRSVTLTLEIQEWALCLFVFNVVVYGCLVSEIDLFCFSGFYRSEITPVMVDLHQLLEKPIYHIAASETVRLKRLNKKVRKSQRRRPSRD